MPCLISGTLRYASDSASWLHGRRKQFLEDDVTGAMISFSLDSFRAAPPPSFPRACAATTHEINPSRSAVVCQIRSVRKLLNALTMTFKTSGIWSTQMNWSRWADFAAADLVFFGAGFCARVIRTVAMVSHALRSGVIGKPTQSSKWASKDRVHGREFWIVRLRRRAPFS